MKKLIIGILLLVFSININAQDKMTTSTIKTVALEQTKGEFTQKAITLSEGTYVFEIANVGVDHEIGFVLAQKGNTDAANNIKEAYVTANVPKNNKGTSNKVTLTKGEYVYFCPLNPTPQYSLIVQ